MLSKTEGQQQEASTTVLYETLMQPDKRTHNPVPTWPDIKVWEAITSPAAFTSFHRSSVRREICVSYSSQSWHLFNSKILKPGEDNTGLREDNKKRVLD